MIRSTVCKSLVMPLQRAQRPTRAPRTTNWATEGEGAQIKPPKLLAKHTARVPLPKTNSKAWDHLNNARRIAPGKPMTDSEVCTQQLGTNKCAQQLDAPPREA